MRTWGASGAGATIRRAQAASAYARRTGCAVDEAAEIVEQAVSRRRFLAGAGAAAAAASAGAIASPAGASGRRDAKRGGSGAKPSVVIVDRASPDSGVPTACGASTGSRPTSTSTTPSPGAGSRPCGATSTTARLVEEHAEFINPEHTAPWRWPSASGSPWTTPTSIRQVPTPNQETMRFHGRSWPQATLNQDWHDWGWQLFHDAAFTTAPWPMLYNN